MTTENDITITMQDVDVVASMEPRFKQALLIAATARIRSQLTQNVEREATEVKKNAKR